MLELNKIYQGDALTILKTFPDESVNCCITSPPYWVLRDYGIKEQLGLEPTFQEYINRLCDIFNEVKRVLRKDGTCWVNMGDTYYSISGRKFLNDNLGSSENNKLNGLSDANKLKDNDELEQKNLDRFTVDFEYIFFFVKSKRYWFETQYEEYAESSKKDKRYEKAKQGKYVGGSSVKDYSKSGLGVQVGQEIRERTHQCNINKGRNKRAVWTINSKYENSKYENCNQEALVRQGIHKGRGDISTSPEGRIKRTKPFKGAHFATYPPELVETPIKAGCPEFVCNKCNKPREKIIEIISGKGQRYSDCGCKAGFSGGIVGYTFLFSFSHWMYSGSK